MALPELGVKPITRDAFVQTQLCSVAVHDRETGKDIPLRTKLGNLYPIFQQLVTVYVRFTETPPTDKNLLAIQALKQEARSAGLPTAYLGLARREAPKIYNQWKNSNGVVR